MNSVLKKHTSERGEFIKELLANRILSARMAKGLTRKEVCRLLSESSFAPTVFGSSGGGKILSVETYRPWEAKRTYKEDGKYYQEQRSPGPEWIPALLDVFDCDVGYLFGEYEERTKDAADVCGITGLSEAAVEKLKEEMNEYNAHSHGTRQRSPQEIISRLLTDDEFWRAIYVISSFSDPNRQELSRKLDERTYEGIDPQRQEFLKKRGLYVSSTMETQKTTAVIGISNAINRAMAVEVED